MTRTTLTAAAVLLPLTIYAHDALAAEAPQAPPAARLGPGPAGANAVYSAQACEAAIDKAVQWLWSRRNPDGSWGTEREKDLATPAVAAVLMKLHVNPQDPRMAKAMDWLEKNPPGGAKAPAAGPLPGDMERTVALYCAAYHEANLATNQNFQRPLERLAIRLYRSYSPGQGSGRFWLVAGLRTANEASCEIPSDIFRRLPGDWLKAQAPDGSWADRNVPSLAATLEGAFAVAYCQYYLGAFSPLPGPNKPPDPFKPLHNTFAWLLPSLSEPLALESRPIDDLAALLFRLRLLCETTGRWRWGGDDVFRRGAALLLAAQNADGSWGKPPSPLVTADTLNFLQAGRESVVLAHFRHGGNWNPWPFAVQGLTGWLDKMDCGRQGSAWEVLDAGDLLHTPARIVLITGDQPPPLNAADEQALKDFAQRGGMIFSCGPGLPFARAMENLYGRLFPGRPVVPCGPNHPLYTNKLFFNLLPGRLNFAEVHNGARPLAVHSTTDLALPWHSRKVASQRWAFEAFMNLMRYSCDIPRTAQRGQDPHWPVAQRFQPRSVVRVARLNCDANWNAEPLAWERFRILLGNREGVKLEIRDGVRPADLNANRPDVVILSGTGVLKLSDADRAALKQYVAGGGRLVVEAIGGSQDFAVSALGLLEEMYGRGAAVPLKPAHALFQIRGMVIQKVDYTREAKVRLGRPQGPNLHGVNLGQRTAVIFSAEDITCGLLGRPCYGVSGYEGETAYEILRNILLHQGQRVLGR